jgi:hypothetical protein
MELLTFSLYCTYISLETVDIEYTYYSWCMTSTDIVKWRKTKDYENFEKGMIYMNILKNKGVVEEETPWCRLFLSFQNICLCILRLIDLYSVCVLRLKLNHVFIIVLLFFYKFISWMEFHAIISIISVSGRETPCFLWKFWKRNDLYEHFEKQGGSRGGNEIHASCACGYSKRKSL